MTSKWKNKFNWQQIKDDIEKEKDSKSKSYKDDRFWQPDWKQAIEKGKFYTIRFLPDQEGNPFVQYYTHAFKYPNSDGSGKKWYINNCISTFGWDPKCPICAKNSEYYDSPYESDKEIAKDRKRKQHWVSNILVVNDPFNPENNGKVFLYKYGFRIYKKLESQMFPSEADLDDPDFEQFVPFDLFGGADFKLKIKDAGISKDVVPNYDDSAFSKVRPVTKDEAELDTIMESTHNLDEFLDPKKYPSVEDTLKQIGHILGATVVAGDDDDDTPAKASKAGRKVDEDSGETGTGNVTDWSEDEKQSASSDSDAEGDGAEESTQSEDSGGADLDDDEAFFANLGKG